MDNCVGLWLNVWFGKEAWLIVWLVIEVVLNVWFGKEAWPIVLIEMKHG